MQARISEMHHIFILSLKQIGKP